MTAATLAPVAVTVRPGDVVTLVLPWSEVCMHMRVAGRAMRAEIQPNGVQLLNDDGSRFSFPILPGEAGLYRDARGALYGYDIRATWSR